VLQNLFDMFVKQVKIGLEKGLPFAKAVDGALNFAAQYFHDPKSFEEFSKAAKKLDENNFADSKNLAQLRKTWGNITVKDLQKYGFETSSMNYLKLQLNKVKGIKNQEAVLKTFLKAEARSIKNIDSKYLNTNEKLINFIKKNIKEINPKLANSLKVKNKIIFVGKEEISSKATKEIFKNSIKQGNFSESIEISNTSQIYFENLMEYYLETDNIKDAIAHIKLLSIDQRGLLRQLAKPNLYVSVSKKLKDTKLEHDPPVNKFLEAIVTVLQNPKKYSEFKSNILANYHINLIPNSVDDILTKEGLQNDLPDGVDIFKDPNARMKIPAIEKALKEDKGIYDLKNQLQDNDNVEVELNEMLERTKGIKATERVSVAKAKTLGAKNERVKLFLPNTAEDLLGLLYRFAGKGKQGDADLKWIKETFTRPLTRANLEFEAYKLDQMNF
jgi:hypothetical protein